MNPGAQASDGNYLNGNVLRDPTSSANAIANGHTTRDWTPSSWSTFPNGQFSTNRPLDDEQGTGVLDVDRRLRTSAMDGTTWAAAAIGALLCSGALVVVLFGRVEVHRVPWLAPSGPMAWWPGWTVARWLGLGFLAIVFVFRFRSFKEVIRAGRESRAAEQAP